MDGYRLMAVKTGSSPRAAVIAQTDLHRLPFVALETARLGTGEGEMIVVDLPFENLLDFYHIVLGFFLKPEVIDEGDCNVFVVVSGAYGGNREDQER